MNISDNTLAAARGYFENKLSDYYPKTEIDSFFWIAIWHYFGIDKKDYFLDETKRISESDLLLLRSCIKELQKNRPIQYILGRTEFYGLELNVNPSVLIPRPETEELVDYILKTLANSSATLNILDIGTGSGCIPLALKKNLPKADVHALDVSKEALDTAKLNAKELELDVNFFRADILKDELEFNNQLDVIVSNPPYVRNSESARMKDNVLKYEPHLALFVNDEDPLVFHRKIGEIGLEKLKIGGFLFFEINEDFGLELKELLINMDYQKVEVRKDLSGRNRLIRAVK